MDRDKVSFGRFRLDLGQRKLSRGEVPVQLGSRALDILCVLASAKGEVVSKDELMARVWPGLVVEENNIQVHVSALRKALDEGKSGESYLVTVPGRGYRLVGLQVVPPSPGEIEPRQGPALPEKPSIAVLPFQNMSGDVEQEYFADGIVEDTTTALSRFPSLFVIARNSSFTYKGRAVDIKQVGRELGVRYVLEGSVRKAGNRVRISGQLVQAETGVHVWAERYDRDFGDIFALQDEMTTSIVGALVPSLERAEIERARAKPPGSLDAYDLYLRGLAAFNTWTRQSHDQALKLFEQALDLDPNFVVAIVMAERCWTIGASQGWRPPTEALAQSAKYARRAVQLDPDDSDALATLARRTANINGNHEEATFLAEQAVNINPNSAYAWRYGGWAFVHAGQPETALRFFEQALRLSPRDPSAYDKWTGMAAAFIQLGRDADAIAAARKAVAQNPSSTHVCRVLASALGLAGMVEEAHSAARRLIELDPTCSLAKVSARFSGWSELARARYLDGLRRAGVPE